MDIPKKSLESFNGTNIDELISLESEYETSSLLYCLEIALDQKDEKSDGELLVLTLLGLDREVNNGGLSQFLDNSTRQYAHRVLNDLNKVGLTDCSEKTSNIFNLAGLGKTPTEDQVSKLVDSEKWEEAIDNDEPLFAEEFDEFDDYYYDDVCCVSHWLWPWLLKNKAEISPT